MRSTSHSGLPHTSETVFADTQAYTHVHEAQCLSSHRLYLGGNEEQKLPKVTVLVFLVWQIKDGHSRECGLLCHGGRDRAPTPASAPHLQFHKARMERIP